LFWQESEADLLKRLGSGEQGLGIAEAARRRQQASGRALAARSGSNASALLLRQFSSPIILILLGAALLSFVLASPTDGLIILTIVALSGLLGFQQEHGAARAVAELLAVVELRCTVRRIGGDVSIPMKEVVPGDLVLLAAGDGIWAIAGCWRSATSASMRRPSPARAVRCRSRWPSWRRKPPWPSAATCSTSAPMW
jgi:Mg2+-importing ATPase